MAIEIPADFIPFVERMVAGKRFLSASDVLEEGLRLLQARETLREEITDGFAQLDAGRGVSADDVYSRAEQRVRELQAGQR